jgi:hypothetical protein
LKRNWEVVL